MLEKIAENLGSQKVLMYRVTWKKDVYSGNLLKH